LRALLDGPLGNPQLLEITGLSREDISAFMGSPRVKDGERIQRKWDSGADPKWDWTSLLGLEYVRYLGKTYLDPVSGVHVGEWEITDKGRNHGNANVAVAPPKQRD